MGPHITEAASLEGATGASPSSASKIFCGRDIDPIDQANACVDFFRTRKTGITADEIIDLLITFERDPERIENALAETFSAIGTYTGKSYRSITNGLTLLRLPTPMQNDLKTGLVGPTIGYVFAANLGCNRSPEFYESFLKNPTTVKALQNKFKQYWDAIKAGQTATAVKKPFRSWSPPARGHGLKPGGFL